MFVWDGKGREKGRRERMKRKEGKVGEDEGRREVRQIGSREKERQVEKRKEGKGKGDGKGKREAR